MGYCKPKKAASRLHKRRTIFDSTKSFNDLEKDKRLRTGGFHRPGSLRR